MEKVWLNMGTKFYIIQGDVEPHTLDGPHEIYQPEQVEDEVFTTDYSIYVRQDGTRILVHHTDAV